MKQKSDIQIKLENYLAENFPAFYLELIKDQLIKEEESKTAEIDRLKKEIFEVLAKAIDEYMAENCREIVGDEIKNFLQSTKFRKMILSMLVESSKSTGG